MVNATPFINIEVKQIALWLTVYDTNLTHKVPSKSSSLAQGSNIPSFSDKSNKNCVRIRLAVAIETLTL